MDADGGDLPRGPLQPDAGQAIEARSFDTERRERLDERLLEIADVLLDVAAVALQIEDRIADELAGAVKRRLAAAIGLDNLDRGVLGDVELAVLGPPSERDDG